MMGSNFEDRFCPATLKKKRIINFELDVQQLYTTILAHHEDLTRLTIKEFKQIWIDSHMIYIHWCRIDSEDPDEFYQALYEVIINKYYESQQARIFGLYCLYFSSYGSEEKNKIAVDPAFTADMALFLKDPKVNANPDICFVAKKLADIFSFTVRIGVKTILLRGNGQPLKRHTCSSVLDVDTYVKLEEMVDYNELKEASHKYEKLKKQLKKRKMPLVDDLHYTDKFAIERIQERLESLLKDTI